MKVAVLSSGCPLLVITGSGALGSKSSELQGTCVPAYRHRHCLLSTWFSAVETVFKDSRLLFRVNHESKCSATLSFEQAQVGPALNHKAGAMGLTGEHRLGVGSTCLSLCMHARVPGQKAEIK